MVGAYVCFFGMSGLNQYFEPDSLAALVIPSLAGTVLAILVCTVLGVVIERLAYKPLRQFADYRMLVYAIVLILVMLITNNPAFKDARSRVQEALRERAVHKADAKAEGGARHE